MTPLNNTFLEEGPHDDSIFIILYVRIPLRNMFSYCEIFSETIIKQFSKEKLFHTGVRCGKEILFGNLYERM